MWQKDCIGTFVKKRDSVVYATPYNQGLSLGLVNRVTPTGFTIIDAQSGNTVFREARFVMKL